MASSCSRCADLSTVSDSQVEDSVLKLSAWQDRPRSTGWDLRYMAVVLVQDLDSAYSRQFVNFRYI